MKDSLDLSEIRRRKIAEIVERRGSVAVRDLCDELGRSEATIRRDLRELGRQGIVSRTHGGVMAKTSAVSDLPNDERKLIGWAEKQRIAQAAMDRLNGQEVVFLDAGTTALAVAELAGQKPGCRYVTTCLGVANRLKAQGVSNFYMIGGSYLPVNDSFVGSVAIAGLRSLTFDVSFFCCSAVNLARECIEIGDEMYALIQREALASSRQRFFIADHRKFETYAFTRTAGFDEIDGLITNVELAEDVVAQLCNTGMEVVTA
ncbi:DeoR/GlpR family DNA-binding transcription regulator [Maliponia aquimaris]|uniref:Lactose phosphotransferase system repressor n=1 Tax=Maliponia aquimaris TaxID=1673631 RepID=A0A238KML8_9RHOB|nr:DeoR/GlpR family DNA-binding transcription regulator [Maliponia aquimaris]SMX44005.1 Lactose phosphotransferase system repressor [Maliponia aquimaris]